MKDNIQKSDTQMADMDDSTDKDYDGGDLEKDQMLRPREKWGRALDFLVACIGFSVGLGNVWRFPYLCYNNGGGAFLLPYIICVAIGGVPLFYLEVAVGQFMSVSGLKSWNICPIFKGIGLASLIVVSILNCYYNVVIGWALYYMFASFTSVLPWSHCDNVWNTDACTTNFTLTTGFNFSVDANDTMVFDSNVTVVANWTDSVTEFWERKVLGLSDGIENIGGLKWDVTLCFLLAWILVYLCICKGIRTSGKVMYFTALTPYVLLTAMLVRGATLSGSMTGVLYFVKPQFHKLASIQVWVDAGTQVFFSYSIALGILTALGSYNKFTHNSYRDAIIFAFTNSGTSVFSGFVIFSVLGHMSYERGVPMDKVAEKGPGLTFLVYPRALMEMFAAPAWSVVFFFTILLLGIDSQFVQVEGLVSAIIDQYPRVWRVGYRREMLMAIVCGITFLVGLSMCTEGGMYVFLLFDHYGGSKIVLLIGLCQCIAVAWIYGVHRFYDDIESMLGRRIGPYMYVSWLVLSPSFCGGIFIMSMVAYSSLKYEHNRISYEYPEWAVAIGWIMAFSSIVFIPIVGIVQVLSLKSDGRSLMQAIKEATKPVGIPKVSQMESDTNNELFYKKSASETTNVEIISMKVS